ncbi:MAG: alpha/beta fold hydrolase [Pseudonocardia sp.]|nr:alpha/beta fold hydrolase [Pseudonocardia sp.]
MSVPARGPSEFVESAFVEIETDDGRRLAGLRYDPLGATPVASLLHIHGKGGNFYTGPGRFIPVIRRSDPVAQLSINMRCHDLGYTREDVPYGDFAEGGARVDGGMWEDLDVGWRDLDAGVRHLQSLYDAPVFVTGHSSGGFYLADYASRRPEIAGRILLSPLFNNKRPFPHWFGGPDEVAKAVRRAEELVAEGRGDYLIPLPVWFYGISARSLVQRAAEADDIWASKMSASESPILCVVGGKETRVEEWRALIDQFPATRKEFVVVDGADHLYGGSEEFVADTVVTFALDVAAR